jgi:hypothetical protein
MKLGPALAHQHDPIIAIVHCYYRCLLIVMPLLCTLHMEKWPAHRSHTGTTVYPDFRQHIRVTELI